jgi:hypothetical protein
VAAVVGAHHAQGEAEADSDGYARCLFKATGPHGGTPEGMRVTVNSDSRAYVGFTTTIVHLVQFPSAGAQPIRVNGLGKDADWVPGPRTLLAATNSRFVTIKVLSHGTGSPPDRAAAIRVARAALR